ncbi:MAG TPA: alpha-glucan family phosphorylase [Longimicrobiales bacterium]|nr:alpha-glucan family phosphorylase [Longimicrobiales bacterium]
MTDPAAIQLPAALAELLPLSHNLRWSWHAPTRDIFERIDAGHWRATGHNPVRLLVEVGGLRLEELAGDPSFVADVRAAAADLQEYLGGGDAWHPRRHGRDSRPLAAYFSAEFGFTECLRIFSGGLGVLAGDHLKSASDLGVPLVGVGLFYSQGYFTQQISADGVQHDAYTTLDPRLLPLTPVLDGAGAPLLVTFPLVGREAFARIWRADVGRVPVYLLDTHVAENRPEDRGITDRLYGGDNEHRLRQEIALGIGGMRALRAVGCDVDVIHLNEGHAAFAAVERARGLMTGRESFHDAAQRAAGGVVFTTHTPVAAGHDYFPPDVLERYLGGYVWEMREAWDRFLALGHTPGDPRFCMTAAAIRLSSIRNGVSRLHGVVSRTMWQSVWPDLEPANVPIRHITNGVHLPTWVGPAMAELYRDRIGSYWQDDADEMHWHRSAHIPVADLWRARTAQRAAMVEHVRECMAAEARRRGEECEWTRSALDPEALTIVFARRFATYKRATLLLSQPERLARLLTDADRPVQFIFAGKAHPKDIPGQALLREIVLMTRRSEFRDRFVFLEGYDVRIARSLVQGADVWLNVPLRPYEASGTSGMKAAANGGLNLSIPDGWWAEAWEEHNRLPEPIGWSIEAGEPADSLDLDGPEAGRRERDRADADALFRILEDDVVPLFHDRSDGVPGAWALRMRSAIRQCAGFFNTHRMVREYVELAYMPAAAAARPERPSRVASGTSGGD